MVRVVAVILILVQRELAAQFFHYARGQKSALQRFTLCDEQRRRWIRAMQPWIMPTVLMLVVTGFLKNSFDRKSW